MPKTHPKGQLRPCAGVREPKTSWARRRIRFQKFTSRVQRESSPRFFILPPDTIQNIELQLFVVDKARTFGPEQAVEKQQANHSVRQVDKRAMLWEVTTEAGEWTTTKLIFADPQRNSIVQRITFRTLKPGRTVSDYDLFVFNKPGISLIDVPEITANNNTSRTVSSGKRTMISASIPNAMASALAVSLPWKMVSNGFYGLNDGWTDLFGPGGDRTMKHHYDSASGGNVAQMGWLDLSGYHGTEVTFDLVLAFGANEAEAMKIADATLDSDLAAAEKQYVKEWHAYTQKLKPQTDDEYYLAAMTIKSSADKETGGIVAGLGAPWGDTDRPQSFDGYHQVWSRDLFKFALALLAAGDTEAANRAVTFLFKKQMLPDGHFPRLSFTSGLSSADAHQMDEVAMPIILAWKLQRGDLWPEIRQAADFIVANGRLRILSAGRSLPVIPPPLSRLKSPVSFARPTLRKNRMIPDAPKKYLQTADYWRNNIAGWLFTTTDPVYGRHYIRLNGPETKAEDQNPNAEPTDPAAVDKRSVLDGGFLELVRLGVLSPHDWSIVETLPAYDAALKQTVRKGDAFFRYNYDRYGEYNDGRVWGENNTSRGRLWPFLTAERGIYEIERSGDGAKGLPYLTALRSFASPAGFLAEQIYNAPVTFHHPEFEILTPPGKEPGDATGSMRPLNWAMGEYINLLLATQTGQGDAPQVVRDRYLTDRPQVKVTFNIAEKVGLVGDSPLLGNQDVASAIWLSSQRPSISLPANSTFHYKFFRREPNGDLKFGPPLTLTTPAKGEMIVNHP